MTLGKAGWCANNSGYHPKARSPAVTIATIEEAWLEVNVQVDPILQFWDKVIYLELPGVKYCCPKRPRRVTRAKLLHQLNLVRSPQSSA